MRDLRRYSGWALITGASSGIGEAFARQIAAVGVPCFLVARREERLKQLAQELTEQHGVQAEYAGLDLARETAPRAVLEALGARETGMLVNNAGFACHGQFETRDADRMADMVRLNCLTPVMLTRAVLPGMLERGTGAVIMVSSLLGVLPAPYDAAYGASKAFGLSFSEALWGEMQGRGIDVITVCPGPVDTEFFDASRLSDTAKLRMRRMSNTPEQIVRRTLHNLGRKPTTSPVMSFWASTAARCLPRRLTAALMARAMRRYDHIE